MDWGVHSVTPGRRAPYPLLYPVPFPLTIRGEPKLRVSLRHHLPVRARSLQVDSELSLAIVAVVIAIVATTVAAGRSTPRGTMAPSP